MSPVTNVGSRWSGGDLIFYEKNVSLGTIGNILTIGDDAVTVGSATNDINFSWLGTTTGTFVLEASAHTLVMTGLATSSDGALTITNATPTSSTTTGALIVTGGIATAADITCGDDLFMSDAGVINWNNGEATITHTTSDQLVIAASYAGLAITLSPSNASGFVSCGKYLRLYMTDTDGTVEGQVWYDNSEDELKYRAQTLVRYLVSSDTTGKIHLRGYLRLLRTDTDADAEGLVWYDNSEDEIKFYGTAVRTLISSDTTGNVTIPANGHIYLDGATSNYIYGNSDDQVFIVGARAGLAIYLDPSDPDGYIQCGGYFKLMGTDTDGTLFAQMWFDASEDKIKYHNGTAVRTIISSDSSGDITTVGHLTIPDDKYLYFGNTTNFIQGNSDNQLILTGSYAGLAIYLNPSNATGYIQCGGFLRLQVTADVGDVEGQIWYDSGANKLHFWDGTAEQEVNSAGA